MGKKSRPVWALFTTSPLQDTRPRNLSCRGKGKHENTSNKTCGTDLEMRQITFWLLLQIQFSVGSRQWCSNHSLERGLQRILVEWNADLQISARDLYVPLSVCFPGNNLGSSLKLTGYELHWDIFRDALMEGFTSSTPSWALLVALIKRMQRYFSASCHYCHFYCSPNLFHSLQCFTWKA